MKYANALLTLILILLAFIVFKLAAPQPADQGRSAGINEPLLASNQALINSIQRLETQLSGLRQELADFKEKVLKK